MAIVATSSVGVMALAGCTSGPSADITCSAYAKLSDQQQEKAAENVLKKKRLATYQYSLVQLDLQDFCKIMSGEAADHQDDPISSDPDIHG